MFAAAYSTNSSEANKKLGKTGRAMVRKRQQMLNPATPARDI